MKKGSENGLSKEKVNEFGEKQNRNSMGIKQFKCILTKQTPSVFCKPTEILKCDTQETLNE